MKRPIRDFGQSVRERLLTLAHRENVQLEYILLRYAIERFLYRLSKSEFRNQFVMARGLRTLGRTSKTGRTSRTAVAMARFARAPC